jgi:hypothetical protein
MLPMLVPPRSTPFFKPTFGNQPQKVTQHPPTHALVELSSSGVKVTACYADPQGQPVTTYDRKTDLPTSQPNVTTAQKEQAIDTALKTSIQDLSKLLPQGYDISTLHWANVATGPFRNPAIKAELEPAINNSLAKHINPDLKLNIITGTQEGTYFFNSASQGVIATHPEARVPGTKIELIDMGGNSTELAVGRVMETDGTIKPAAVTNPNVKLNGVMSANLGLFNHKNGNHSETFSTKDLNAIRRDARQRTVNTVAQDRQHWYEYIPVIGTRLAMRRYRNPDILASGSKALYNDLKPLIKDDLGVPLNGKTPVTLNVLRYYINHPRSLETYANQMASDGNNNGTKKPFAKTLGTEISILTGVMEALKATSIYFNNYGSVRDGVLRTQLAAQPAVETNSSTLPPDR